MEFRYKRRILVVFLFMFIIGILVAGGFIHDFAAVSQQFDDSQILVSFQKVQELGTGRAYTYRVANRSKFAFKHARLFVSFDINQNGVSRQNPFKLELTSVKGSSEVVKPGQEVIFNGFIPVKELFSEANRFDFNGPNVELSGYVIQGREEIPFTKTLPPVNIRLTSPLPQQSQSKSQAAGPQDRNKQLINDLMKYPELIPYKGVLGGKMGFYQENNIKVLNDRWVFAEFEDGHIGGAMLLEYKVSKDGTITWKVLESDLAGE